MKNYIIAGTALALFTPMLGQAAPINWTSESYTVGQSAEVDVPAAGHAGSQSVASLVQPFVYTDSVATSNGSATTDASIKSLPNATRSDYEIKVNAATSYHNNNPDSDNFYASLVPVVSIDNIFTATSSVLNVGYDFSSIINFGASVPGLLSYQDLGIVINLSHIGDPFGDQTLSLVNYQASNDSSVLGESKSFSGSGVHDFNLVQGGVYELYAYINPTFYTTGTVANNNSNSMLKLSISDTNVVASPVPEPETYAMLMAGLVLIGFSAKRKTN